jgi:membrane-associated PAP2 superfamily phosphatase
MKIKKLAILLFIASIQVEAQPDSTIQIYSQEHLTSWKNILAVPSLLVGLGLIAINDNDFIYRQDFYEQRNKKMPHFRTHVDDYLQYVPIVGVITLNAIGVKGKHNIMNQTVLLIKSELIMTAIIFPLKKLTAIPRPDTHTLNSFPSGHTAQAFAAATFLHKEYGREHPLFSILGYSTATGIGLLRVMNNRHWISDVLVGAGIGILSTNMAYLTHQNKWGNKHRRFTDVLPVPFYSHRSFGMSIVIHVH